MGRPEEDRASLSKPSLLPGSLWAGPSFLPGAPVLDAQLSLASPPCLSLQTRLQAGVGYGNTLSCIRMVYRKESVSAPWAGGQALEPHPPGSSTEWGEAHPGLGTWPQPCHRQVGWRPVCSHSSHLAPFSLTSSHHLTLPPSVMLWERKPSFV